MKISHFFYGIGIYCALIITAMCYFLYRQKKLESNYLKLQELAVVKAPSTESLTNFLNHTHIYLHFTNKSLYCSASHSVARNITPVVHVERRQLIVPLKYHNDFSSKMIGTAKVSIVDNIVFLESGQLDEPSFFRTVKEMKNINAIIILPSAQFTFSPNFNQYLSRYKFQQKFLAEHYSIIAHESEVGKIKERACGCIDLYLVSIHTMELDAELFADKSKLTNQEHVTNTPSAPLFSEVEAEDEYYEDLYGSFDPNVYSLTAGTEDVLAENHQEKKLEIGNIKAQLIEPHETAKDIYPQVSEMQTSKIIINEVGPVESKRAKIKNNFPFFKKKEPLNIVTSPHENRIILTPVIN